MWFQDILNAWNDRIFIDDQTIFDIVRPDPPRTADNREFTFDLIVSQGIEAPRRAGLVTVLQRDDIASRAAYAVAVSLSQQTSGHEVVQSTEYLHGCQMYHCSISHAWFFIPFTMEPVHDTQEGDSFVVAVTSRPEGQATSSTNQIADADFESMDHTDDVSQPDHDMDSEVPSPSLAPPTTLYTGVHIHRLGHQQTHG